MLESLPNSDVPPAYRLAVGATRAAVAQQLPSVVFIEATNRCNLRCQTCLRTFRPPEPAHTLAYAEFLAWVEQFPAMRRCLLHGIGEPLLNPELPRMIAHLHDRGVETIINSNGTLLSPAWQIALVESGLDEYRCSVDAAGAEHYARLRGFDFLPRILDGLRGLFAAKSRVGSLTPRISLWCVATRENLAELPELVKLAARLGISEVYVQRLVYFANRPGAQFGLARQAATVTGAAQVQASDILAACQALAAQLGIDLRASGARDPGSSLANLAPAGRRPWEACMRPWTAAYVTAHGNCLPCCIAPFATPDYDSLLLGSLRAQPFDEIWNGTAYRLFRTEFLAGQPHPACTGCGVHWSL